MRQSPKSNSQPKDPSASQKSQAALVSELNTKAREFGLCFTAYRAGQTSLGRTRSENVRGAGLFSIGENEKASLTPEKKRNILTDFYFRIVQPLKRDMKHLYLKGDKAELFMDAFNLAVKEVVNTLVIPHQPTAEQSNIAVLSALLNLPVLWDQGRWRSLVDILCAQRRFCFSLFTDKFVYACKTPAATFEKLKILLEADGIDMTRDESGKVTLTAIPKDAALATDLAMSARSTHGPTPTS